MRSEAFHIVEDICCSKCSQLYRSTLYDIELVDLVAYLDPGKPA